MSPRFDLLRKTLAITFVCVGFLALMGIPDEDLALSRWCMLMLASKGVAAVFLVLAYWLYNMGKS